MARPIQRRTRTNQGGFKMTEEIYNMIDKFCDNIEGILKARKYYKALKQIFWSIISKIKKY